jgi:hypothetical protein
MAQDPDHPPQQRQLVFRAVEVYDTGDTTHIKSNFEFLFFCHRPTQTYTDIFSVDMTEKILSMPAGRIIYSIHIGRINTFSRFIPKFIRRYVV